MLRMPEVARFLGYEPNRSGFIKSPFSQEKTASCKLYDGLGKGFMIFQLERPGIASNLWQSLRTLTTGQLQR